MNDHPYYTFNREERNHAALLYHLLLTGSSNLGAFLELIGHASEPDLDQCEVYFEYAFLRDYWKRVLPTENKREWILKKLPPTFRELLHGKSVTEWNEFFKVRTSKASKGAIQSPANWVTKRISDVDHEAIKALNLLKWCFNLKPDLVIRTPGGKFICIEAKMDSKVSRYTCQLPPTNGQEGSVYSMSQINCQREMFAMLPDAKVQTFIPVLLVKKKGSLAGVEYVTWSDVFEKLDKSKSHPFVQRWTDDNLIYKS